MRACRFSSNHGGVTKILRLESDVKVPRPSEPKQTLVRVLTVSFNPVDHKPAETLLYHFALFKTNTPGADLVGEIVQGPSCCPYHKGDSVSGTAKNAFAGGMLAEYAIADMDRVVSLGRMSPGEGAAIAIAELIAVRSIISRVKPKSHIFINGGSGTTGTFEIQIAIAEIIDYTRGTLLQDLKAAPSDSKFNLVVDNIYTDSELFWEAEEYTKGRAICADSLHCLAFLHESLPTQKFLPRFLGGGPKS
ncbi:hypothetical protein KCU67_g10181, partial [Aureobasidium melanogenum]